MQTGSVKAFDSGIYSKPNPWGDTAASKASMSLHSREQGEHFLLEESSCDAQSVRFPKSGSRKILAITELLEQQHIMMPAKYEVWQTEDGVWQGDLLENPTLSQSAKLRSLKKH